MILKGKLWIARILQYLVYFFIPVKSNRMMFYADRRKGEVCNPASIMEYIRTHFSGKYELFWVSDWPETCPEKDGVRVIGKGSFLYYFYFLRTKYFVTNDMFDANLIKKKGQTIVCTWHGGGAYKKVGYEILKENGELTKDYKKWYGRLDYFISSCRKCSDTYPKLLKMSETTILDIGCPRNDLFFQDYSDRVKAVRTFYQLPEEVKIMLFAPSFCKKHEKSSWFHDQTESISFLLEQLQNQDGKNWVCLYRTHYFEDIEEGMSDRIYDGNAYFDMQDLICTADILVTDFSSSIWDAALLFKPVFLLSGEVMEYEKNDRGFIVSPEKWPFMLIEQIEDIAFILNSFDETEYRKKLEQHLKDMGSFETGDACHRFVKQVLQEHVKE